MAEIGWIEDDYQAIYDLVSPLEKDGHSITTYESVTDVRKRLDEVMTADVIIVDIRIPDGRPYAKVNHRAGLELLTELRANGVGAPAIILSVTPKTRLDSSLNVLCWLEKPVSRWVLRDTVEQVLSATL